MSIFQAPPGHDPISGTHMSLPSVGATPPTGNPSYVPPGHDPISGTHMSLRPVGPEQSAHAITTDRLAAFSDGVFSIVITLLVLTFKVPLNLHADDPAGIDQLLRPELLKLVPLMLTYALSFILVGIFWIAHHNVFIYIVKINRTFIWLNLLLLMGVSYLPFPTALLGTYPYSKLAVEMYATTLCVTSLAFYALWQYASDKHRLIDPRMDERMIKWSCQRALVAPILYATSLLLSVVPQYGVMLSLILLAIVPATYIVVPSRVDKRWMN